MPDSHPHGHALPHRDAIANTTETITTSASRADYYAPLRLCTKHRILS